MKKITILLLLMIFVSSGVVLGQQLSPNATHAEKVAYDQTMSMGQPAFVQEAPAVQVTGDRAIAFSENFDEPAFPPPGWTQVQYDFASGNSWWTRSTNVNRHLQCCGEGGLAVADSDANSGTKFHVGLRQKFPGIYQ